ncbi:hypothetical protein PCE1_003742 [Barthelona sp. PCE]
MFKPGNTPASGLSGVRNNGKFGNPSFIQNRNLAIPLSDTLPNALTSPSESKVKNPFVGDSFEELPSPKNESDIIVEDLEDERMRQNLDARKKRRLGVSFGTPKVQYSVANCSSPSRFHVPEPEDRDGLRIFMNSVVPEGVTFRCTIIREKKGFIKTKNTFFLYSEMTKSFLCGAQERSGQTSTNIVFSVDKQDISRDSEYFLGKLRRHLFSKNFVLYDDGENPETMRKVHAKLRKSPQEIHNIIEAEARTELGLFCYTRSANKGIMSSPEPVANEIFLPNSRLFRPTHDITDESMGQSLYQFWDDRKNGRQVNESQCMHFVTREPIWNAEYHAFSLDFKGRVSEGSVKNFQLVSANNPTGNSILQFGKTSSDSFVLDFGYPFTPMQAFGLATSVFYV